MKKLPKIYQNEVKKNFNNNEKVYYSEKNRRNSSNSVKVKSKNQIIDELNSLKKESGFIFNKPLIITTKDKTYDTAIVKMNNIEILTLNEDIIKIEDIISIERK